jgi:hypothetical protein
VRDDFLPIPSEREWTKEEKEEFFSSAERHAELQRLRTEEDEQSHARRLESPDFLLLRIDNYLTSRCDLAYLAYYRRERGYETGSWLKPVQELADIWRGIGDAREEVRKRAREFRQGKLRGTKTLIHASKILGEKRSRL